MTSEHSDGMIDGSGVGTALGEGEGIPVGEQTGGLPSGELVNMG
jgi:hypothetical protein